MPRMVVAGMITPLVIMVMVVVFVTMISFVLMVMRFGDGLAFLDPISELPYGLHRPRGIAALF